MQYGHERLCPGKDALVLTKKMFDVGVFDGFCFKIGVWGSFCFCIFYLARYLHAFCAISLALPRKWQSALALLKDMNFQQIRAWLGKESLVCFVFVGAGSIKRSGFASHV